MTKIFNTAKWIWKKDAKGKDQYCRFIDSFRTFGRKVRIRISCDSNYALYVNGNLASFGQYADYPHYKVYDEIDLSEYVQEGENRLAVLVWYYGENFSTSVKGNAGLIYEVREDEKILCVSKPGVLCQIAPDYANGLCKVITGQLGYSYRYDASKADKFPQEVTGLEGWEAAEEVTGMARTLYARPNRKCLLRPFLPGRLVDAKKRIYDLGCERVGLLEIVFCAPKGEKVTICYGEHLKDGEVRRRIGSRDFSVEIMGSGTTFHYLNPFRRLGCRYLQIVCDAAVEISEIGIREVMYPLNKVPYVAGTQLRQRIYDTSVRTLELCMHEHYEDCPWREQALYCMDSRNQMLCGYYAFGETVFARSCLLLMSKAQKPDGLLPLCFPAGTDVPIPFFSLIYLLQMREYAKYSGDLSLLRSNLQLLEGIAEVFLKRRRQNGLITAMQGYWNFYEWNPGMDGIFDEEELIPPPEKFIESYDLPLNCFLILGLQNLDEIFEMTGIHKSYAREIEDLQRRVFEVFFDENKKLFRTYIGQAEHFGKLSNALAVLTGCAGEKADMICERIVSDKELQDTTLSMRVFYYDALLKVNPKKYRDYILSDIDEKYGYMLQRGATSFWETILGEDDFSGAGSLCHGWSAVPVYYYHILKEGGART